MKKNTVIAVLVIALLGVGIWGYSVKEESSTYRQLRENAYQRDFTLLLSTTRNLSSDMQKISVSGEDEYISSHLADIGKYAQTAKEMLTRLPVSHRAVGKLTSYFSRVEDFSSAMISKIVNKQKRTQNDRDAYKTLMLSSKEVLCGLEEFYNVFTENYDSADWEKVSATEYLQDVGDDILGKSFYKIDRLFIDYPTMIYDGPFSDHLKVKQIRGLRKKIVSHTQVEDKIRRYAQKGAEIKYLGTVDGDIKQYAFSYSIGDISTSLYYSVYEGKLISANADYPVKDAQISVEEGEKYAQKFLKSLSVGTMCPTYYESYQNVGVYNFAYEQDGVKVYSDLIKVKVALSDGAVIGYDASGYYQSHMRRELPKEKVGIAQARKNLKDGFIITAEDMAVIPCEGEKEYLCYEFKGIYEEENYIIYIDTQTGRQRKIFKIIEADESVLTL